MKVRNYCPKCQKHVEIDRILVRHNVLYCPIHTSQELREHYVNERRGLLAFINPKT